MANDWERFGSGGDSITLKAWNATLQEGTRLDPDPQLFYGSSVIDFGAPSTFNFIFSQGIVSTAGPGTAEHTNSSNTTDGGVNGVTAVAAPPPAGIPQDFPGATDEIAKYTLSIDGGTNWISAQMDLSPSFAQAPGGGSSTQGPFFENGPGPSAGPYTNMRVDVNVALSGGNDRYAFNGRASITDEVFIPEPSSAALTALGLVGVALGSGRRSGKRAQPRAPIAVFRA